MAAFLSPLRVEYLDGEHWSVLEPFEYRLGAPDGVECVTIAAGFITDFASIPRVLWNLLPPTGPYGKAAVIHDWLYQYRAIQRGTAIRFCERGEADRILREGMEVLSVPRLTRWLVYGGVRTGGWATWRHYRSQEASL